MFSKKTLFVSVSFVASNFMMLSQTAFAQAEPTVKIDEVVVTARKREESLQDVPLAVTALNAKDLENLHISVVTDIDKLVPNVDLGDNPFAGQALGATIRGVGFSDLEKSFEPAVGFSIDGVFLASNTGGAIDGFDIEQIEVLRGPQGTLFGRNTVGGVINVTRSRPTGEAGVKLGTRITNHNGEEFFGVVNAPQIGGVLSAKAYGFSKKSDTFATNIVTGEKDKQTDSIAVGAAFLYEPSDRLEALVSVDYFDDDSNGPPTYSASVPSGPDGAGDLFCDIPSGIIAGGAAIPNGAGCASGSLDIAEASNFELFARGAPFVTIIDGWSATANISYELSDNLTLTSITGYRETDEQLLEENVGGPNVTSVEIPEFGFLLGAPTLPPLLYQNRVQSANQFSQELRLSGNLGDNLDFVTGVYFLDSEYDLTGGEFPDGSFGNTQVLGGITAITETAQQSTALAVFVDGTYDITGQLSFSGGFRYSYEEKNFQNNYILAPTSGITGTSIDTSESWNNPTWRAILQYDISDDAMIYGGYARGFRSGGFNGRAASVESSGPYDEETLDSFEIGSRIELFDNRIRFNPTAFYAKYDDKQEETASALPGSGGQTIETFVQNASQVDIKGVELEVLARLTPELTVRGAFGYVDAEFDEFLVADLTDPTGATFIDVADSRNLRSGPDETVSLGATYSRAIMDGKLQLTLDAAYSYQDGQVTSASSDPLGLGRDVVDQINSTDFSITIETLRAGANVKLSAFINDAFDGDNGRVGSSVIIPNTFTFATGAVTKLYGIEATVEF